jgi:hypothetical protein
VTVTLMVKYPKKEMCSRKASCSPSRPLKFNFASNRCIDRSLVKVRGMEFESKFNSVKSSIKLRLNKMYARLCKLSQVYDNTIEICMEPAFVYAEISWLTC